MANPLVFGAGTTTATVGHAIKVTKAELVQASATAATAVVQDINGNLFIPTMTVVASVGASQVLDYAVPIILPGGSLATPLGSPAPTFVVIVTGAGASLYLTHR